MFFNKENFKENDVVNVLISHVDSPGEVFVQIVSSKHSLNACSL